MQSFTAQSNSKVFLSRLVGVVKQISAQITRVSPQWSSQLKPLVSLTGNWASGKANDIIHNRSQRSADMQSAFKLNNAKCHRWS